MYMGFINEELSGITHGNRLPRDLDDMFYEIMPILSPSSTVWKDQKFLHCSFNAD